MLKEVLVNWEWLIGEWLIGEWLFSIHPDSYRDTRTDGNGWNNEQ
ncbi:hypothetical protein [Salinimicrobium gaetbulicola]|uniref:Uncharacterized protein n=1 Tax=Salinimicrobium gaetbulicola TaxID=999702 RepID=A0ABW3IEU7_9FLAO